MFTWDFRKPETGRVNRQVVQGVEGNLDEGMLVLDQSRLVALWQDELKNQTSEWGENMAATRCGWCGTQTHMTEFGEGVNPNYRDGIPYYLPEVQGTFSCDQCGRLSIGSYYGNEYPGASFEDTVRPDSLRDFWMIHPPTRWSPEYVEGQQYEDVPEHIAAAASEAHKSASVGNIMSAILMARTVIEATAKDQGITGANLYQKIDNLASNGLIRPSTQSAAHVIRDFGNDMAHGDISAPVETEDAEAILILMGLVLHEVFQVPATTNALKAKFEARKRAAAE